MLDKNWRIVPRGISLVIGCATFPTWNGYPAIFASLATGNSVIVKPHPGAILPLAITVKIARDVLKEAGFDPNVIMLAPDNADAPVTKDLVTHPDIAIVDFTGSSAFGRWVRENAATDVVFTEEAGINSIVIDSTSDFRGLCNNIAFSLSLYSGQMCTAPQNIFVPAAGIDTNDGKKSFDEVASGIATAIDKLLGDPERAATILGAVQNEATIKRVERRARARPGRARFIGRAGRGLREGAHRVAAGSRHRRQERNRLGRGALRPDRLRDQDRIDRARRSRSRPVRRRKKGAITASVYSTNEPVIDEAAKAFARAGVALSVNLTGGVYVNQSAAFSDYHVTGANPAGNACLTDSAFVANRFRVATVRRQKAA